MEPHAFVQNIKGEKGMKKILVLFLGLAVLSACAFHGKQEKDETYYKRTQGIEWPSDN